MRSGSLRMLGGTHYDVQVPLPRLPASDRRWICPGTGCAFVSISCDERPTAVPLHPEHGRRQTQAWLLLQMRLVLTGGESVERDTGIVGVTVGSLDDPSWFRPQMDFFVSDVQPWDQMDPAIPKYDLYPPSTE